MLYKIYTEYFYILVSETIDGKRLLPVLLIGAEQNLTNYSFLTKQQLKEAIIHFYNLISVQTRDSCEKGKERRTTQRFGAKILEQNLRSDARGRRCLDESKWGKPFSLDLAFLKVQSLCFFRICHYNTVQPLTYPHAVLALANAPLKY